MHIVYNHKLAASFFIASAILLAAVFLPITANADAGISAFTYYASNISPTSATLNGYVNPSSGSVSYWFEYGVTTALGNANQFHTLTGTTNTAVFATVTGLEPNTSYYFRAVAQNGYSTVFGPLVKFSTLPSSGRLNNGTGGSVAAINGNGGSSQFGQNGTTTSTNQYSCVTLVPASTVSPLIPGKPFTLVTAYKNGCAFNLSNAYLKVILPPGAQFVSASYPILSRDANGITYSLGAIPADYQSAVSIEAVADSSLTEGDSIMFSAILNFDDASGNFQSESAYLPMDIGKGEPLSANVIETIGNLLGNWIFDLILVLSVASLATWAIVFKRGKKKSEEDILEAKPLTDIEGAQKDMNPETSPQPVQ